VGRIHVTDDIEEIVARHFQEWGEIDRIRVLTGRGVAFVTYVNEANSQFAKEAMAHQALDNNEVLNVRWATVDPNPLSQKREAARIEDQAAEAVRRALGEKAVREIEGRETREQREQRKIESSYGLDGYEAPEAIWFNHQRELDGQRMGERALLEGAPANADPGDEVVAEDASRPSAESAGDSVPGASANGIFGTSTLAALRGYASNSSTVPRAMPAPAAGPLVGYGSDEDDD